MEKTFQFYKVRLKPFIAPKPLPSTKISILQSSIKTFNPHPVAPAQLISILQSSIKTPHSSTSITFSIRFQFYKVRLKRRLLGHVVLGQRISILQSSIKTAPPRGRRSRGCISILQSSIKTKNANRRIISSKAFQFYKVRLKHAGKAQGHDYLLHFNSTKFD